MALILVMSSMSVRIPQCSCPKPFNTSPNSRTGGPRKPPSCIATWARRTRRRRPRCGATWRNSSLTRAWWRSPGSSWWPLLYGLILPLRSGRSAAKYAKHLDSGGLAAVVVDRQASQTAARLAGRTRPQGEGALRDALRKSVDRLAARRAEGRGRDPHPHSAGLSPVFGHDHGQHGRRRDGLVGERAQLARAAIRQSLPRRPRLRPGAGATDRTPLARTRARRSPAS